MDTGVRNEETAGVWRELLADSLKGQPITRVFVTHMHPDHVGMAGWLTRKFVSNGMDAPTRSGIDVPKWKRYSTT